MGNSDLVFFVQLHIKPERVDEWKNALTHLIDRMSEEPAFVTCFWDQSTDDPNLFTLYERWREASVDEFIRNQMKGYRKAYEDLLPGMLQTPRSTMILKPIQEWRRLP